MNNREKELQELGFKKKWLDDKSGYWFEYKPKDSITKIIFYVDFDYKQYELQTSKYEIIKSYANLDSLLKTIKEKNIW